MLVETSEKNILPVTRHKQTVWEHFDPGCVAQRIKFIQKPNQSNTP